jgi:hypothetical protein
VVEVADGVAHVVLDQVGVEGDGGCGAGACGGDDLGAVDSFDTKVPHWFGSTGGEPAEILSIFGRPGERMTVRTTPP